MSATIERYYSVADVADRLTQYLPCAPLDQERQDLEIPQIGMPIAYCGE